MKTFRFRKPPKAKAIPLPSKPSVSPPQAEQLMGSVHGKEASAPEERLAKALDKAGMQYEFRYVVGAPKGLPGWKELDFLVSRSGVLYAIEVDTAFTHRGKQQKDRLHDAIILNDKELNSMGLLWPMVFHADGESDLASQENSNAYVKRLGK